MAAAKKTATKKTATQKRASSALQRKKMLYARAAITKVFKKSNPDMVIDPGLSRRPRPHIPSGSLVIDYLIGGRPNRYGVAPCPGWPKGALSNVYGMESSGKTTVALMAASRVIAEGGVVCFIDWEHALDLSYAKALGIPIDDDEVFYVVQPDTMEMGLKILYIMVKHEVDLVILDSVGAPISEAIDQQKVDEQGKLAQVGWLAKAWSQYLPKLVKECGKSGTHVMGIAQVRSKISTGGFGFGKKTTEQGGNAWKFYSSVRMSFVAIQSEKGKVYNALSNKVEEQVVARKIQATVDKSKVSQMAHNKLNFWVVFGEGIDNLRTVIEVAVNHGVLKKGGGGYYSWERSNGDLLKAQGLNAFRKLLTEAGALDELNAAAMRKVSEATARGSQMVGHEVDEEDIDLDAIMNSASPDFTLEDMKEEPHPEAKEPEAEGAE